MAAEDNLLKFYSSNLCDKLKKIVRPLSERYGLDGFFYTKITPDGFGFQITNRHDVANAYFSNQLYKSNPFICHPDNYKHDQALITSDFYNEQYFDDYYESIKQIKNSFGFDNYLCVYKKEADTAHVFMFSTTDKNLPTNTLFSNHLPALKRFSEHFLKEWSPHSNKMEPFMLNLGELMDSFYGKINRKLSLNDDQAKSIELLRKMGLLDELTNTNFTKRELDCIEYFLKGYPASQIADSIDLQTRTVEHYLDNIKTKLNCFTKSELFEILQEFKTFGLI